jgi:PDZ domain-containing protein
MRGPWPRSSLRVPSRRGGRRAAFAVLVFILAVAAFVVPIPIFFTLVPGPVRDVQRLVRVSDARTYSSEGRLYMTTVSVDVRVTAAELVAAALHPHRQVVLSSDLTQGRPLEEVEQRERQAMDASQHVAEDVALSVLGFSGRGARVVSTVEGSPARGVLQSGDVIVSVEGRRVGTICDLGAAIDRTRVGEEVTLTVRRGGDARTFRLRTTEGPDGGSFIGVGMEDVGFGPDVSVEFETGRIAGPSAGLMFTLALYDRLTQTDLTGGRVIAGTGAIDCGGVVRPIGGVVQKVAAAESKGAEVFLAPSVNAPDARSAADEMRIVAVSDFKDAVEYLEGSSSQ